MYLWQNKKIIVILFNWKTAKFDTNVKNIFSTDKKQIRRTHSCELKIC